MKYLLDTNVCIGFLRGKNPRLLERFEAVSAQDKYLCPIVVGELFYGAAKSHWRNETLASLSRFLARFEMLPYDLEAARHFGDIRAYLAAQGKPIGPYDVQIAAIARAHGAVLVTHNTDEFSRVPDLTLEDWESDSPTP